jgi:hypothetical protein
MTYCPCKGGGGYPEYVVVGNIKHFFERLAIRPFRYADAQTRLEIFQVPSVIPFPQISLILPRLPRGGRIRQDYEEFIAPIPNHCIRSTN